MVAVEDAEVGSGADYYVAKRDASRKNMEEWLRFEVAGVGRGGYGTLAGRCAKVEQVRQRAARSSGYRSRGRIRGSKWF